MTNKNDATDILPSDMTPNPMSDADVPIDGPKPEDKRQKLYDTARALLGQRVIPLTELNKFGFLGCAQHLNAVYKRALGVEIGGGASTALMDSALKDKTRFTQISIEEALPGDIVMYATGTSTKYPQAHGHVLLMGKRWCMANSSESATWEASYTVDGMRSYFEGIMGFPPHVYRVK